jgi:gluconokinase
MASMPEPGLVIGVDIGTSGVKVTAVDTAAIVHHGAEQSYQTDTPRPGWSEQAPDAVAAATAEAIREVATAVQQAGRPIAGVALSAAMHSLIGVAADGSRLTPCFDVG